MLPIKFVVVADPNTKPINEIVDFLYILIARSRKRFCHAQNAKS